MLLTPVNLPTYQNPATDTLSTIDLTFVGANVPVKRFPHNEDYLGSDHFPVTTIVSISPDKTLSPPKWTFDNKLWSDWNAYVLQTFLNTNFLSIVEPVQLNEIFTKTLVAASCIFFKFSDGSQVNMKIKSKVWFNADCKSAIQKEHKARRNYLDRKGTKQEWNHAQAIKKRTILRAKRIM